MFLLRNKKNHLWIIFSTPLLSGAVRYHPFPAFKLSNLFWPILSISLSEMFAYNSMFSSHFFPWKIIFVTYCLLPWETISFKKIKKKVCSYGKKFTPRGRHSFL